MTRAQMLGLLLEALIFVLLLMLMLNGDGGVMVKEYGHG